MNSIELDRMFVILSFLADSKHAKSFAWHELSEIFGCPIYAAKHIRKAAKKAIKHVRGNMLTDQDLIAIRTNFLIRIGLDGYEEEVIAYDGRFYFFKDGRWHYEDDVNPETRPDAIGEGIIRF